MTMLENPPTTRPAASPAPGPAALPPRPVAAASREGDAAPATRAPHLVTRDFRLSYGVHEVLKGITLDILEHSVTAIIGPSGCGKSTLLRSYNRMNDLIPGVRTSGEIRLGPLDLLSPATNVVDLRRRVGMVFQRPNPFPMSVFDNVAYGLRLGGLRNRGELERRVESSLRDAALWDEVHDRLGLPAHRLSGGQQQRLCIARCIAVEPEVLLMDEPASALDPASTTRVEELVLRLKDRYTIVIVTHNMQQAARVSDRTAFLMQGHLVETGDTRQIFTNPREHLTEEYITGRFG